MSRGTLPEAVGQRNLATIRRIRRQRLREHGYRSYADYLGSPRWTMIRAVYFMHPDTVKACPCGANDETKLNLHHTTYERVGSEDLNDLRPLCAACHHDVHLAAERGLAPYDLKDHADEDRRRLYANERRAALERQGETPDCNQERPYSRESWTRQAEARREWAQDRRKAARAMTRTLPPV